MDTINLMSFSDQLADVVERTARSVVQVSGRRRPASGVVYAPGVVITMARVLGREEGAAVRTPDGRELAAELAGWDPTTGLAVLRAPEMNVAAAEKADAAVRVGQMTLAIARSWSNAVTASAGVVAVIGGPLRTGGRRAIAQIFRTTAPMHDGFAGGALADVSGRVVGIATASVIRGLGVVIPGAIAWQAAADILQHGGGKSGFLGIASHQVTLAEIQRRQAERDAGVLVAAVTAGSPADRGGVLVGDVILEFAGQAIHAADDLLDLLTPDRVGHTVPLKLLRGDAVRELHVTVGERPAS